jgi:hypothetical protein
MQFKLSNGHYLFLPSLLGSPQVQPVLEKPSQGSRCFGLDLSLDELSLLFFSIRVKLRGGPIEVANSADLRHPLNKLFLEVY